MKLNLHKQEKNINTPISLDTSDQDEFTLLCFNQVDNFLYKYSCIELSIAVNTIQTIIRENLIDKL